MFIHFSAFDSTKTDTTNLERAETNSSAVVLDSTIRIDLFKSQNQGNFSYQLDQQFRFSFTINDVDCICYNIASNKDRRNLFAASNDSAYYNYTV